ncbi:MAG: flagellar motor protein MotB, partial [Terriglobales bacterium]
MNRRNRRSSDHMHAGHERWLISYADFITLLLAFFVVMYASSRADQQKAQQLSHAISAAFTDMGVFTNASPQPHLASAASPVSLPPPLVSLEQKLARELHPEIERHALSLHQTREGLVIRLQELGFFDSGSDAVRPGAMPVLARIASALAVLPNQVRIEGYTDNVPIHNARFASNWQLSTARATELVRIFINFHLDPARLSAAGYAQYHPIASNAAAAGRQLNRRVDLVVVGSPRGTNQEGALPVTH